MIMGVSRLKDKPHLRGEGVIARKKRHECLIRAKEHVVASTVSSEARHQDLRALGFKASMWHVALLEIEPFMLGGHPDSRTSLKLVAAIP